MKKFAKILFLPLLICSCNIQANSTSGIQDSATVNDTSVSSNSTLKVGTTKKEIPSRTRDQSGLFESEVGSWVFVKSNLSKDYDGFISPSFNIYRANIQSAGYAYFVQFSKHEQEWILSKFDESTLVYGQNDDGNYTGAFIYDPSSDQITVKISDVSDAEYKRK